MLRVVGLQRCSNSSGEFVLFQNQGALRLTLRGHAVAAEETFDFSGGPSYFFADPQIIPPSAYVILYTGDGENRWARSKDGTAVYHVYMGRSQPAWSDARLPLSVMSTCHQYVERSENSLLMR